MPVASLPEIMDRAFEKRYGVAAFNTVDDITMHGVIRAAEQSRSPLIVQISVKTVKFWGAEVVQHMFTDMATAPPCRSRCTWITVPIPEVARACLKVGWNSVLFDGSGMSFEENSEAHQRDRGVRRARSARAVEGEVVAVAGVEDGMGSDDEGGLPPIEKELEFIEDTGIYCYAPPIGTAHGFYKADAEDPLRPDGVSGREDRTCRWCCTAAPGLTTEVYQRLIALGAAKVNISTALKKTYADGFRTYLEKNPTQYDPLKLIGAVQNDVTAMAQALLQDVRQRRPGVTRALIFDCDGVLADTERDGHLVAFNQMWREQGVNWQWTLDQYAVKLKIGGGKERIASLARDDDFRAAYRGARRPTTRGWRRWPTGTSGRARSSRSSSLSGAMPGRPGVRRLAQEAHGQGWTLAVCSTSALAVGAGRARHASMGKDLLGEVRRRVRRRHRQGQEAGAGHLQSRGGRAWPVARATAWSSRIRATGCWPRRRPAWRASSPRTG